MYVDASMVRQNYGPHQQRSANELSLELLQKLLNLEWTIFVCLTRAYTDVE